LEAILGERAIGLSATNIVRLKAEWEAEYKDWNGRNLSQKCYVYLWADGIYFNVRLDEERSCVLVLIGALEDGTKELIAVVDGYRESTQSWRELLSALVSPAHHQSDRIDLCQGPASHPADQRLWFPDRYLDYGI
jgi:putative transposase